MFVSQQETIKMLNYKLIKVIKHYLMLMINKINYNKSLNLIYGMWEITKILKIFHKLMIKEQKKLKKIFMVIKTIIKAHLVEVDKIKNHIKENKNNQKCKTLNPNIVILIKNLILKV